MAEVGKGKNRRTSDPQGSSQGGSSETLPGSDLPPDWAEQVLQGAGLPVNASTIQALLDIATSEVSNRGFTGGYDEGGKYNPFDYVQTEPGSTNYNNLGKGEGVQDYTSWEEGKNATIQLITQNSAFASMYAALQSGNGQAAVAAYDRDVAPWSHGLGHAVYGDSGSGGTYGGADAMGETVGSQGTNNAVMYNAGGQSWDLSLFPPQDRNEIIQAINKYVSEMTAGGTTQPQEQKEAQELSQFDSNDLPISMQDFLSDPQLRTILVVGAMSSLSLNNVFDALQNTTWWKTNDANQRYYQALQSSDPATAHALWENALSEVEKSASALGVRLTSADTTRLANYIAANYATMSGQIQDSAFNADTITRLVASYYNARKMGTTTGGDVSDLADAYDKLAGQYMIPIGKDALDQHVQAAIQGDYGQANYLTGEESGFEQYLKQQAMSRYPYMASAIQSGITPYAWADPYRQDAAQILQLNPNEIKMTDPKFQFALTQVGKDGQKVPMSLAEFGQVLRSDPKYGYQYTDDANAKAWSTASQLLGLMGAVPNSVAGGGTA